MDLSFPGDYVEIGKMKENVMLNLVQHLIRFKTCETLKQVQGDRIEIVIQSPMA